MSINFICGLENQRELKIKKLNFLRREEAITSDAGQKFSYREQIKILENEIAELTIKIDSQSIRSSTKPRESNQQQIKNMIFALKLIALLFVILFTFFVIKKYITTSNLDIEIKRLKKEIQVNEKEPKLHFDLGLLQNSKGDHEDAEISFKKAIQLNYPKAKLELAWVYIEMGDYSDAINEIERYKELSSPKEKAKLYAALSIAYYYGLGKVIESKEYLQNAIYLNPNYENSKIDSLQELTSNQKKILVELYKTIY